MYASTTAVALSIKGNVPMVEWDFEGIHFRDGGPLTVQYILVLDALNFCFWPDEELQYEHLARGLTRALERDAHALDAHRLVEYDGPSLRRLLQWSKPLPLEDERARLLQEVGLELQRAYNGEAVNLLLAANGSAPALVDLVTRSFAGFQDHSVYKGQQIALYKRAQIFVGDIWGAFRGEGLGSFSNMEDLTMFADYLVPAILREWGVLIYGDRLAAQIDNKLLVPAGSEEEVELRACTVDAVESLRKLLTLHNNQVVLSVQVDWWLWFCGLQSRTAMEDHHRTLTIYY
eukprot:SM000112S23976  [mRNA]  locus=s112:93051:95138:+ [translate_table: standard]